MKKATRLIIEDGDKLVFIDGALEVLQKIKSDGKIRQFVVTNGLVANQKRKLEGPELSPIFEYAFISDEVGFEKPTIEFFNKVFEKIGNVPKNRILIIGDSLTSDIRGGNNAGIKTCWFNPSGKKNTKNVTVDYEISDLRQILNIIEC